MQGKFLPVAALLGFTLLVLPAAAQQVEPGNLFEVTGVRVDVVVESSVQAKILAIRRGRRQALKQLFQRLVLASHRHLLPLLPDDEIEALSDAYEISSEKTSGTRYLATVGYDFLADQVRQFLKSRRLPYSEVRADALLVLPVLVRDTGPLLFDEANVWLETWNLRSGDSHRLVPLFLPFGDIQDLADLSAKAALAGDAGALAKIAQRYGVKQLLVSRAEITANSSPVEGRFTSVLFADGGRKQFDLIRTAKAEQDQGALMAGAAAAIVARLNDDWKASTVQKFEGGAVIRVQAAISGAADWVKLRRQLSGEARVINVTLVGLSQTEVEVDLEYTGSIAALKSALLSRRLVLAPIPTAASAAGPTARWTLLPAKAKP